MNNTLEFLHDNKVESLLDIGANVGYYSRVVKQFFPHMRQMMIEANPHCEQYLKQSGIRYTMSCLFDQEKVVDFYLEDTNDIGTGASIYKENTRYYNQNRTIQLKATTLDDVLKGETFEFIKFDTQGSEIDIMAGGKNTLAAADYISIELSLIEYNHGAPLKEAVVKYVQEQFGFNPISLVEEHYFEGRLIQEDWIFARN